MKEIGILYEDYDDVGMAVERNVEVGYLIAPGIAVIKCVSNTLYFVNVRLHSEGGDLYEQIEEIADINVMNSAPLDITSMPAEALTFALWAAGSDVAVAVAV